MHPNPRKSSSINKKFGTAETLSLIFYKPQLFQKLIEQGDISGDVSKRMGYSQTKYEILLSEYLATYGADDKSRYRALYALDNLKQANILIDWDKSGKRLTFSESFIELIRLSDERLIRELTSVEYKGMLEELKRLKDKLNEAMSLDAEDENYFDIRHAIFNHLRRIRTAIRTNEVKFNTISAMLADISSGITDNDAQYAKAKREMYAKASRIYSRHIKPTVEFLDKSIKVEGGNLFDILTEISECFSARLEYSHVEELHFSALNLSNSYKPIEKIAEQVRKFLSITRNNARSYNAFEQIQKEIDRAVKNLKDTSLKNKSLGKNELLVDVFDFYKDAEGAGTLKAQSGLLFSESPAFFDNMKTELDQLKAMKDIFAPLEILTVDGEDLRKKGKDESREFKRGQVLVRAINNLELYDMDDMYGKFHDILSTTLPYYTFFDLNVALDALKRRLTNTDHKVSPTGYRKTLIIDGKTYQYNQRRLRTNHNG